MAGAFQSLTFPDEGDGIPIVITNSPIELPLIKLFQFGISLCPFTLPGKFPVGLPQSFRLLFFWISPRVEGSGGDLHEEGTRGMKGPPGHEHKETDSPA